MSSSSDDGEGESARVGAFYAPPAAQQHGVEGAHHTQVFDNGLFRAEDDEGDLAAATALAPHAAHHQAAPSSSSKLVAQRSAVAARRHERLQASLLQSNSSSSLTRSAASAAAVPPLADPRAPAAAPPHGLQGMYDPNEPGPRLVPVSAAAAGPSSRSQDGVSTTPPGLLGGLPRPRAPPAPPPLDLSNLPAFLMQPGPTHGTPRMCYIVRDKGLGSLQNARYALYLEDPKVFLLAARKRKKPTSNYLVSRDHDDLDRASFKYFGKLRATSVLGNEFVVYDRGDAPGVGGVGGVGKQGARAPGALSLGGAGGRQELAAVRYETNVLGLKGPRKMTGVVPALSPSGQRLYRPEGEGDSMLKRLRTGSRLHELVVMRNKPPRWNDEVKAFCLNFDGRVTEASVKNFQLVSEDSLEHIILQFGKIGKDTFTMDYKWPISAMAAFCICLSSFDNKLACE